MGLPSIGNTDSIALLWVELCLPKRCVQVLTPALVDMTLLGNWVFEDVIKFRGGSYWIRVDLNAVTSVLLRRDTSTFGHSHPQGQCHRQ